MTNTGNLVDILMDDADLPEEKERNFDPVPVGEYACVVTKCKLGENSKKNGSVISMEYQIIDGEFENRLVWDYLNVLNPNPKAQEIGNRRVRDLSKAMGKDLLDTDDFINEIVTLSLGISPETEKYKASNTVKYIKKYVKGAVQAPAAAPKQNAWDM